jgi:hypothetical protein
VHGTKVCARKVKPKTVTVAPSPIGQTFSGNGDKTLFLGGGSFRSPPVRLRNGGAMFRYRLHSPAGDDLGEATYPDQVKVGEELFFGGGRRFRVLDVVPFDEECRSSVRPSQTNRAG